VTGGGCGARLLSPGHQADPPTAWLVPPASSADHRGLIRGSRLGDQETTGSAAHDAISYESFDISERARWIRPRSRVSTPGCDRSQASPGKLSGKYFPDRKLCRLIVPVARILGSRATKPARCTRGDAQVDGGPLPPGDGRRDWPPLARRAGAPLLQVLQAALTACTRSITPALCRSDSTTSNPAASTNGRDRRV